MRLFKLLTAIIFIVMISSVFAQENSYVGTKKCKTCHKSKKAGKQYVIWQASKHSKAYETLKTKEADEISMKKDKKKAIENDNCLKCHAPQHNVNAKLFGKKFKIEDGVQCETCHGPGSKYAKMKTMKNKEKAIAAGLKLYDDPAKELCIKCHN
jgi:uncharacterized protein with PIN domain